MKKLTRRLVVIPAMIFAGVLVLPLAGQAPILLDTDMNSDCDDAGALGVLHALADKGEAKILGVASCTNDKYSAPAIEAINIYYGRPDIPVAQIKQPIGFTPNKPVYLEALATEFPNKLRTAENALEPVAMYRRILASQPDKSVIFVAIGWLTNLRNLLNSSADQYSNKTGRELVAQKVKVLVDMGPWINPPGHGWNFKSDPLPAVDVVRDWPTPIVFSPKEICWAMTGGPMNQAPADSPVRRAYELWKARHKKDTNHSADHTAIIYAVRGARDHWTEVRGGHLEVREDGYSEWKLTPNDKRQSYLAKKMSFEDMARVIDELMIQPPRTREARAGAKR
jgi:inosine-uridine nucleoside N-ribohydrolase